MRGSFKAWLCRIFLTFIVLSMFGCAFGTRQVGLRYNSSMYPALVQGSPSVKIDQFNDKRTERSLGCVRNGWGMKLAAVEPKPGEPSVSDWIADALIVELERAGCSVVTNGTAQFVIGGDLQRIYVDSYMSMQGDMSISVSMKSHGRTVIDQLYHAEASKVNWWGSSREFQQTLDMTLQNLMERMVPDIIDVMSSKRDSLSETVAVPDVSTSAIAAAQEPVVSSVPSEESVEENQVKAPAAVVRQPVADAATQLKKLKELKDLGMLTEEEFEAKRKELVGQL